MKKFLIRILAFTLILACILPSAVFAEDISLYNNNFYNTITNFNISSNGIAYVEAEYFGYDNISISARITVKIEKRNLLVFWKDVVEETYYVSGTSYANTFTYQLEKTGTYRCTVEYVISGTGGADDVITFEDTKTYN